MNDVRVFSPPRVLVVEAEPAFRQALLWLLRAEGYAPCGVASLDEALAAADHTSFALILADLIAGKSRHSFTPAHILRRHTPTTPMGILTDESVSPWDEQWSVFAFTLSKPVETARLLTEVAACLKRPFSRREARQAEVLRRFVEGIVDRGWSRLLSLCTEDIRYYPPGAYPRLTASPPEGKGAIEAFATSVWQHTPHLRLEVSGIYNRPSGLALRYLRYTAAPDGGWAWQESTELFQFVGDRISQIGVSNHKEPLPEVNQIPQIG